MYYLITLIFNMLLEKILKLKHLLTANKNDRCFYMIFLSQIVFINVFKLLSTCLHESALTDNILESRKLKLRKVVKKTMTTLQVFSHGIGSLHIGSDSF